MAQKQQKKNLEENLTKKRLENRRYSVWTRPPSRNLPQKSRSKVKKSSLNVTFKGGTSGECARRREGEVL